MVSGIAGIAFDCPHANKLADFYEGLTGWKREMSGDEFAALRTPEGLLLVFQTVKEEYVPPIWPWQEGKMAHIDYIVEDLPGAVAQAIQYGATKAESQFYDTSTVMLDPAGHPFCLTTVKQ